MFRIIHRERARFDSDPAGTAQPDCSTARLAAQHFLHTQFFDSPLCLLAEVGFADLDGHLVNLAGELVIAHLVVVADSRIEVLAHVRCFRAKRVWMSVLDPPCGDLFDR